MDISLGREASPETREPPRPKRGKFSLRELRVSMGGRQKRFSVWNGGWGHFFGIGRVLEERGAFWTFKSGKSSTLAADVG